MKKKIIRSAMLFFGTAIVLLIAGTFLVGLEINVFGQQSKGWRIWIRTEPCAGRFDWLSVAREPDSGGGKNTYVPYETVLGNEGCTQSGESGCTFAEATALMESLRSREEFSDYCCRDYSVWENSQTDEMSVFLLRSGTPGTGWSLVKGDLCCEEAEEIAGKPGACSGAKSGGGNNNGGNNNGAGGFQGIWILSADLGSLEVNMTQDGNHVTGTFDGGSLDGTVTGKVLRFKWQFGNGADSGTGEATLSADGQSFSGYQSNAGGGNHVNFNGRKSP